MVVRWRGGEVEWGEGRACRERPNVPHFFFPPHEEKLTTQLGRGAKIGS
jgi:hypothetical protein